MENTNTTWMASSLLICATYSIALAVAYLSNDCLQAYVKMMASKPVETGRKTLKNSAPVQSDKVCSQHHSSIHRSTHFHAEFQGYRERSPPRKNADSGLDV